MEGQRDMVLIRERTVAALSEPPPDALRELLTWHRRKAIEDYRKGMMDGLAVAAKLLTTVVGNAQITGLQAATLVKDMIEKIPEVPAL